MQVLEDVKLPIINERFFTIILKVLASKSELRSSDLTNIKRLLKTVKKKQIESFDTTMEALFKCVSLLVDFKLKNKEYDDDLSDALLLEIETHFSDEYYEDVLNNTILPIIKLAKNKKFPHEVGFVTNEISIYLTYGKVLTEKESLISTLNNLSAVSGTELREELVELKSNINRMNTFFEEVEASEYEQTAIYVSESSYTQSLEQSFNKAKSPTFVLKTGLQLFNQALSSRGGFIPGYYIFYANINSFKSAILQHISRWLRIYNLDVFRKIKKKTGKKPVILQYSLENSEQDDNERDIKIYTRRDMHNYNTFSEMIKSYEESIRVASGYTIEEINDVVELVIDHPKTDLRVSKIRKTLEDLIKNNYIPVAVIVDYIELIKPEPEDMKKNSDFYLGKVSADLLQLYKLFDCPIITAHQLNRAGAGILANAKDSGKTNAVSEINSTYIGKDYDIDKPASFSGFIDIETNKSTGQKYLTFKKGKQRGIRTPVETFAYEIHQGICFEDDLYKTAPTGQLALTPQGCEDMAYAISQKKEISGSRGRINTPVTLSSEPKVNIKQNAITLKDAAKSILELDKKKKYFNHFSMDYKTFLSDKQIG